MEILGSGPVGLHPELDDILIQLQPYFGKSRSAQPIQNGSPILKDFFVSQAVGLQFKPKPYFGKSRSAQPIQNGSPILKDFFVSQVVDLQFKPKPYFGKSRSAQPIQNGSPILKDFFVSQAVDLQFKPNNILTQCSSPCAARWQQPSSVQSRSFASKGILFRL